jgi:hypothetical protein
VSPRQLRTGEAISSTGKVSGQRLGADTLRSPGASQLRCGSHKHVVKVSSELRPAHRECARMVRLQDEEAISSTSKMSSRRLGADTLRSPGTSQ